MQYNNSYDTLPCRPLVFIYRSNNKKTFLDKYEYFRNKDKYVSISDLYEIVSYHRYKSNKSTDLFIFSTLSYYGLQDLYSTITVKSEVISKILPVPLGLRNRGSSIISREWQSRTFSYRWGMNCPAEGGNVHRCSMPWPNVASILITRWFCNKKNIKNTRNDSIWRWMC